MCPKGHSFRTALEDVLARVLDHGMHHRGQITLMLRESHPQPPIILSFFGSNNTMFWADHTPEQPWTGGRSVELARPLSNYFRIVYARYRKRRRFWFGHCATLTI